MSKKKMILSVIFGLVGAVLLFGIVYALTSPQMGGKSLTYDSPNFKDGKFKNLIPTPMSPENRSMIKTTFEFFFSKSKDAYPNMSLPTSKINHDLIENTEDITVTWLGHSTTLITSKDLVILTDPVLNNKRLPPLHLGPRPFPYTTSYDVNDLPKVDIVLISHDHYDHLDMETIKKLRDSLFFVPLGVKSHLVRWGVDERNVNELDWYDKKSFSDINLIFAPARHFSGRGLFNKDKTLWGSWIIKSKNKTLYFGGDSGYFNEFKKIGKEYGPFDLVMLDTGQYHPAWQPVHMLPEEVIKATIDLDAKAVLPIHNSKYVLALHSWYEPVERLVKAAKAEEIKIMIPRIGETVKVSDFQNSFWWQDVK